MENSDGPGCQWVRLGELSVQVSTSSDSAYKVAQLEFAQLHFQKPTAGSGALQQFFLILTGTVWLNRKLLLHPQYPL